MTNRDMQTLVVRRMVQASRERVFDAWTQTEHLLKWWGPKDVECIGVSIDLRVGGHYRIGNQMPDGSILWIAGAYEEIERPHRLVFRWALEGTPGEAERVTVELADREGGRATEIVVMHERISNSDIYEQHEAGWIGCLDGLEHYLDQTTAL